jgi:hypothetical protein
MCGESLDVLPYILKEAHHCDDPVEPMYYATQDTRGGQIVAKDICAVCYYGPADDLVAKQEFLESGLTKRREPLPICRDCRTKGPSGRSKVDSKVQQKWTTVLYNIQCD